MTTSKHTLYFTMIFHPSGKWIRVGRPYTSRKTAQSWSGFVRGAWHNLPFKVSQCTLRIIDGTLDAKSIETLDQKFNLDPPTPETLRKMAVQERTKP